VRPLLFLAVVLSACGGPAWRAAAKTDTSASYLAFLAENPDSPKAKAARARAEELLWEDATLNPSAETYTAYVTAFPAGAHAEEARTRAESHAYETALAEGTSTALTAFLARYPNGPHAREAAEALEQSWADEAREAGTEDAWGRYLVRYPDGAHAEEAHAERDRIAWAAATEANTLAAYDTYLDRYLGGAHREEAEAFVASTRVDVLQPVLVLSGTYQPASQHRAILSRLATELEKGLLVELKRNFEIRPTMRAVAGDPAPPAPEPGVGLLVVAVEERVGRAFEPSGSATDLSAVVTLVVPPTPTPVVSRKLTASTPEKVMGTAESTLYTSAVKELGATLRGVAPDIEAFRVPK
jgi:hypothetical protein